MYGTLPAEKKVLKPAQLGQRNGSPRENRRFFWNYFFSSSFKNRQEAFFLLWFQVIYLTAAKRAKSGKRSLVTFMLSCFVARDAKAELGQFFDLLPTFLSVWTNKKWMGYEDPTDLSKSLQVTLTPRFFPLRIPEFEGAEMKTHFHRPSPSALKFPHHIPPF